MGAPRPAGASAWRTVQAAWLAFSASLLVVRVSSRLPFDETVARLRRGKPIRRPLADPRLHLRVVERLLGALPPYRMGPCMKRSLLLLHVWSRCGLEPVLHLGVARGRGGGLRAHAWLSAGSGEARLTAGSEEGWDEAFVFPRDTGIVAGDAATS